MLVDIGFKNYVNADRIISVVRPDSAPIVREIHGAEDSGRAIDATRKRRTRSVIFMDSGHVVLSAVETETISRRLKESR